MMTKLIRYLCALFMVFAESWVDSATESDSKNPNSMTWVSELQLSRLPPHQTNSYPKKSSIGSPSDDIYINKENNEPVRLTGFIDHLITHIAKDRAHNLPEKRQDHYKFKLWQERRQGAKNKIELHRIYSAHQAPGTQRSKNAKWSPKSVSYRTSVSKRKFPLGIQDEEYNVRRQAKKKSIPASQYKSTKYHERRVKDAAELFLWWLSDKVGLQKGNTRRYNVRLPFYSEKPPISEILRGGNLKSSRPSLQAFYTGHRPETLPTDDQADHMILKKSSNRLRSPLSRIRAWIFKRINRSQMENTRNNVKHFSFLTTYRGRSISNSNRPSASSTLCEDLISRSEQLLNNVIFRTVDANIDILKSPYERLKKAYLSKFTKMKLFPARETRWKPNRSYKEYLQLYPLKLFPTDRELGEVGLKTIIGKDMDTTRDRLSEFISQKSSPLWNKKIRMMDSSRPRNDLRSIGIEGALHRRQFAPDHGLQPSFQSPRTILLRFTLKRLSRMQFQRNSQNNEIKEQSFNLPTLQLRHYLKRGISANKNNYRVAHTHTDKTPDYRTLNDNSEKNSVRSGVFLISVHKIKRERNKLPLKGHTADSNFPLQKPTNHHGGRNGEAQHRYVGISLTDLGLEENKTNAQHTSRPNSSFSIETKTKKEGHLKEIYLKIENSFGRIGTAFSFILKMINTFTTEVARSMMLMIKYIVNYIQTLLYRAHLWFNVDRSIEHHPKNSDKNNSASVKENNYQPKAQDDCAKQPLVQNSNVTELPQTHQGQNVSFLLPVEQASNNSWPSHRRAGADGAFYEKIRRIRRRAQRPRGHNKMNSAKTMVSKLLDLMSQVKRVEETNAGTKRHNDESPGGITENAVSYIGKSIPYHGNIGNKISIYDDVILPEDDIKELDLEAIQDQEPTEADKQMLKNIERLTFLVLGHRQGQNRSSSEHEVESNNYENTNQGFQSKSPISGSLVKETSLGDEANRLSSNTERREMISKSINRSNRVDDEKQHVNMINGDKLEDAKRNNVENRPVIKHIADIVHNSPLNKHRKEKTFKSNSNSEKNNKKTQGVHLSDRDSTKGTYRSLFGKKPLLKDTADFAIGGSINLATTDKRRTYHRRLNDPLQVRHLTQKYKRIESAEAKPIRRKRSKDALALMDAFRVHWPALRSKAISLKERISRLKHIYAAASSDLRELIQLGDGYNEDAEKSVELSKKTDKEVGEDSKRFEKLQEKFKAYKMSIKREKNGKTLPEVKNKSENINFKESLTKSEFLKQEAAGATKDNFQRKQRLEEPLPELVMPMEGMPFSDEYEESLKTAVDAIDADRNFGHDNALERLDSKLSAFLSSGHLNSPTTRKERSIRNPRETRLVLESLLGTLGDRSTSNRKFISGRRRRSVPPSSHHHGRLSSAGKVGDNLGMLRVDETRENQQTDPSSLSKKPFLASQFSGRHPQRVKHVIGRRKSKSLVRHRRHPVYGNDEVFLGASDLRPDRDDITRVGHVITGFRGIDYVGDEEDTLDAEEDEDNDDDIDVDFHDNLDDSDDDDNQDDYGDGFPNGEAVEGLVGKDKQIMNSAVNHAIFTNRMLGVHNRLDFNVESEVGDPSPNRGPGRDVLGDTEKDTKDRKDTLQIWDDIGTDIEFNAATAEDDVKNILTYKDPMDYRDKTFLSRLKGYGSDELPGDGTVGRHSGMADPYENDDENLGKSEVGNINDLIGHHESALPRKDPLIDNLLWPGVHHSIEQTKEDMSIMESIPQLETIEDISVLLKETDNDLNSNKDLSSMGIDGKMLLDEGDLSPYNNYLKDVMDNDEEREYRIYSKDGGNAMKTLSPIQREVQQMVKSRQRSDKAIESLTKASEMVASSITPKKTKEMLKDQIDQSLENLAIAQKNQEAKRNLFLKEEEQQEAKAIKELEARNKVLHKKKLRMYRKMEGDLLEAAADASDIMARRHQMHQDLARNMKSKLVTGVIVRK